MAGENNTEEVFKPTPMNEILKGISMFVPDEVEFPDDDEVPMADLLYAAGSATQQPSGKYKFETINGRRVATPVADGDQQQQAPNEEAQPNAAPVPAASSQSEQKNPPSFMGLDADETKERFKYHRNNFPKEPVHEKFTLGDVDFKVIGGSKEDGARVMGATNRVLSTERGKQLLDTLGERSHLWGLINADFDIIVKYDFAPGGIGKTEFLVVDPRTQIPIVTKGGDEIIGTLERLIAHELGHSAGFEDRGPKSMENINLNENPVMKELGEPERGKY